MAGCIAAGCLIANSVHAQQASENPSPALQSQDGSFHRSWQLGGFAAGGFPPSYEIHSAALHYGIELDLLNAGIEAGRLQARTHGSGMLRGRGEAAIEVIPFWLAHYPLQTRIIYYTSGLTPPTPSSFGPYNIHGASVTPVLLRWNFMRQDASRFVPWAQLGGGLLWTNHKFPLLGESTSVINFTPQIGMGQSVFLKKNRSLDFAMKAVHISNAGLGDHNPGLNVTLQFSAGFSWWK